MPTHRSQVELLLAAVVTGIAYLVFLGHRSDYLGHYLAGLGAALGLLAIAMLLTRRPLSWWGVLITLGAIGIGFGTEATLFRVALFDPIDFCNQSLGACIACAGMFGHTVERKSLLITGTGALVMVLGGFFFAFA